MRGRLFWCLRTLCHSCCSADKVEYCSTEEHLGTPLVQKLLQLPCSMQQRLVKDHDQARAAAQVARGTAVLQDDRAALLQVDRLPAKDVVCRQSCSRCQGGVAIVDLHAWILASLIDQRQGSAARSGEVTCTM